MSLSQARDDKLPVDESNADQHHSIIHGMELIKYLEDDVCRTLLSAMSLDWHTAQELSSLSQTPLSTTYRKLNALDNAGVLFRRLRINETGKHPEEYRCKPIVLTLRLGTHSGLEVAVSSGSAER